MRPIVILLLAALLPAGASARDLELFVGARGSRVFSHGFIDHFDQTTVAAPHVGVAFEVVQNLLVEFGYSDLQADGSVFARFSTEWTAHATEAGVRYTWPVRPWLRPYGRLVGGVLVERYRLQGPGLDVSANQVGFELMPLAGVELLWPTAALANEHGLFQKITGGVYLEIGYRYALPFDVGSRTPSGTFEDTRAVPLDLGAFDVQGVVFGGGVVGHF